MRYSLSPLGLPISAYFPSGAIQASTSIAISAAGTVPTPAVSYDLSPLGLPITRYVFPPGLINIEGATSVALSDTAVITGRGTLVSGQSVAWSVSGLLQGSGQCQAVASLAFGQTADLQAKSDLQGATAITVGDAANLLGAGQLQGSATLAISATAFAKSTTALVGSASFTLLSTPRATAQGELRALASSDVAVSATLQGDGGLQAATTLDVPVLAALSGNGQLQASATLGIVDSATLSTNNLFAAISIAWTATGSVDAKGFITASEAIGFNHLANLLSPSQRDMSPLALPIRRYSFQPGQPAEQGSTSIAFTTAATLRGISSFPSNLQASTTVAEIFNHAVWLEGRGQLQATATVGFSESATVTAGENNVQAAESLAFTVSATLTADGELAAASTVDWIATGTADLVRDANGSATVAFSDTVTLVATGALQAATTVRFLNAGMLIRVVEGSTSFGFSAFGRLSGGDFSKKDGQFYVRVLRETDTITVEAERDTIIVAPDSFTVVVDTDVLIYDADGAEDTQEAA